MAQKTKKKSYNWLFNLGKIIYFLLWAGVFFFFLSMTILTWGTNLILIAIQVPELGDSLVRLSEFIVIWIRVIIILLNIAVGYFIIKILNKIKK